MIKPRGFKQLVLALVAVCLLASPAMSLAEDSTSGDKQAAVQKTPPPPPDKTPPPPPNRKPPPPPDTPPPPPPNMPPPVSEEKMAEMKDDALVAMGWAMGQQIRLNIGFTEDELDLIFTGMRSVADGAEQPENMKDLMPVAQSIYMSKMQAHKKQEEAQAAVDAKENIAESEDFFDNLDKEQTISKTDSGLRYQIVEKGDDGKKPGPEDTVTVHYHGTLIDGTVFDSSVERGEPTTFPLNRVIKGWTEGLQLIGEGGKIKLYIPSDLAYGNNPRPGGVIKPGDTLIFDVELIKVGE